MKIGAFIILISSFICIIRSLSITAKSKTKDTYGNLYNKYSGKLFNNGKHKNNF